MAELLMLTASAASAIRAGSHGWGNLTLKVSEPDDLAGVRAVSNGPEPRMPVEPAPLGHFLRSCDDVATGYWYRVPAHLNVHWFYAHCQQADVTLDSFRQAIPNGFKEPGRGNYIAITHAPDTDQAYPGVDVPEFGLWGVRPDGVTPLGIEVEPVITGVQALEPHWPVADLADRRVLVVGAGSIGGAAAQALATYGVGRLRLLDPGRLRWHNLVRHVCGDRHLGRYKVDALRLDLADLRPDTKVESHRLNVVENADVVRDLLLDTDLVLCAADGVEPRQVVSHLARRAKRPAVLACVLEDGRLGEVLRLHPWRDHGCLACQRKALYDIGGLLPEPTLDLEYGTGTTHRPMTAVGGDLHLVGQLAAKVAVATLLEPRRHSDQVLGGEHAVVALRPQPGWASPFDVRRPGEIRWLPAGPPAPGCPTCEPP
jgi:hypothetical protein